MRFSRRDLLVSAGGLIAAAVLPDSASAAGVTTIGGSAFGARWKAVIPTGADMAALTEAIESIVASVDRSMSPFRPDSEISRFNRAATTDWFPFSPDTCAVVAESRRVAALTAGAFNPTVGPIVGRYGFGPIRDRSVGSAEEIEAGAGAVRKARAALSLDLCGIAKGHALDRMGAVLAAAGLPDFLVELGGEILARGRHPTGRPWQVGVEKPLAGTDGFQRIVSLEGAALATSGSAVNSYVYRGRRYSHIIDPATERPAEGTLASVTVAAATAMTADALATALYVMGPERGPAFAEERGIEAFFIMEDGSEMREAATSGFERRILA